MKGKFEDLQSITRPPLNEKMVYSVVAGCFPGALLVASRPHRQTPSFTQSNWD